MSLHVDGAVCCDSTGAQRSFGLVRDINNAGHVKDSSQSPAISISSIHAAWITRSATNETSGLRHYGEPSLQVQPHTVVRDVHRLAQGGDAVGFEQSRKEIALLQAASHLEQSNSSSHERASQLVLDIYAL